MAGDEKDGLEGGRPILPILTSGGRRTGKQARPQTAGAVLQAGGRIGHYASSVAASEGAMSVDSKGRPTSSGTDATRAPRLSSGNWREVRKSLVHGGVGGIGVVPF